RKPTFDLKSKGCSELKNFSIPFAVKDSIIPSLKWLRCQVLKALGVREWSDWKREDLREASSKDRQSRKQRLIQESPGILTGPHGAKLKDKGWLPLYILSATISAAEITLAATRMRTKHRTVPGLADLTIAIILWRHDTAPLQALSVFNNHLDADAKFSSFVVDGESTSRSNKWAVGEMGKGFASTCQFFVEAVEKFLTAQKVRKSPKDDAGVSFRMGHQIGTFHWIKKPPKLRVVQDDLTPFTVEEYLRHQGAYAPVIHSSNELPQNTIPVSEDDKDPPAAVHRPRPVVLPLRDAQKERKAADAFLRGVGARRRNPQTRESGKKAVNTGNWCLVHADEVSITVIGLGGALEPEEIFSGIYGLIPPPQAWRVPDSPIEFFLLPTHPGRREAHQSPSRNVKFYLRDQHILHGPHLNRLSINYHGDFNLVADRTTLFTWEKDVKMVDYKRALGDCANRGFMIPQLGVELALDILTDDHSDGIASQLFPPDAQRAEPYRGAFEAAMRQINPTIPPQAPIYPSLTPQNWLCQELGFTPVVVSRRALSIMTSSGAYPDIRGYPRQQLLSAPPAPNPHGLDRLRAAVAIFAPDVPPENVTIRDYRRSFLPVVWDKNTKVFAFGLPPKCDDHPESPCTCWIGPIL
ncbi:hypothetical protein FB451DRAFT_984673, partial [Mycena latifolia]